jgi:hypothetical protein
MFKKIIENKKQILSALLALVVYLFFHFTNIFGLIISKFKGSSHTNQCVASLTEELQGAKFIFTLAGVPEDKVDTALNEMIFESCNCIVSAAGTTDINAFILNKTNEKTIKQCSEDATGKSVEKYAQM